MKFFDKFGNRDVEIELDTAELEKLDDAISRERNTTDPEMAINLELATGKRFDEILREKHTTRALNAKKDAYLKASMLEARKAAEEAAREPRIEQLLKEGHLFVTIDGKRQDRLKTSLVKCSCGEPLGTVKGRMAFMESEWQKTGGLYDQLQKIKTIHEGAVTCPACRKTAQVVMQLVF
ncbi:MAG TPA: hypothetical protein VGK23_08670 [Methanomassiliicoccales archaeon]